MSFLNCIKHKNCILMEGALGERLKREYGLTFHKDLDMAAMIYNKQGAIALTELWKDILKLLNDMRFFIDILNLLSYNRKN